MNETKSVQPRRAGWLARSVLLALLLSCGGEPTAAPERWAPFEIAGAFTFRGPADLAPQPTAAVDSRTGRWRNAELEVFYDHGWYSDPLTGETWSGARRAEIEIDGRPAVLVTLERAIYDDGLDHVAALHVSDVGDGQTKLTLVVRGARPEDLERAGKILRSVRFPPAR